MARYDPERMELSTRDVVARAIATEVLEGRGTERGGVWLDVTHLRAQRIEERLPIMLEQFLAFGVDIRTEPMEVAPTAHHIIGGLRITENVRHHPPGLIYACGECSGGVHGANRLGGNALAETQVFGRRAGLSAGTGPERVKAVTPAIDRRSRRAPAAVRRLPRCAVGPDSVVRRLKETMWAGAGDLQDGGRDREDARRDRGAPERAVAGPHRAEPARVLHGREHGPRGVPDLPGRAPPARVPRSPHAPRSRL